jgi:hypothetical protein
VGTAGLVNYFVVLPDGQRYGPADSAKLSQWVLEGRVVPDSVLQDVQSGRMMSARDVAGIQWPNASNLPPAPNVFRQTPMPTQSVSDSAYHKSLRFGAISFVTCLLCPLLSTVGSIFGVLKGIEALNQGHPKAQFAIGLNIVALILGGIGILVAASVLVQ